MFYNQQNCLGWNANTIVIQDNNKILKQYNNVL